MGCPLEKVDSQAPSLLQMRLNEVEVGIKIFNLKCKKIISNLMTSFETVTLGNAWQLLTHLRLHFSNIKLLLESGHIWQAAYLTLTIPILNYCNINRLR